ncbi:CLUMA_CG005960, isoform A [Clunio marinus]|uniref:CLUMA_CG005960, isoform A n=1 Tax=Clunio marinus TaxID=568069 RepID=A0A1J1HXU5_9DIPT|nr:CLUMA_CG005960, isoform A [Clunio marinus]
MSNYVGDLKIKIQTLLNNNFDYKLEFQIIDKCFKISTFDPFKVRNGSWIYLSYVTSFWVFFILITLKNIFVDFSGDNAKQVSSMVGAFMWIQNAVKFLVFCFCNKELLMLKKMILDDGKERCSDIERKYRRNNRILCYCLYIP